VIPGLLASEVAAALCEFIVTGFETETAPFSGEFRCLVEEQQDGEAFLKSPYVSIGLPLVQRALTCAQPGNSSVPSDR